jgi:hypothetical protein
MVSTESLHRKYERDLVYVRGLQDIVRRIPPRAAEREGAPFTPAKTEPDKAIKIRTAIIGASLVSSNAARVTLNAQLLPQKQMIVWNGRTRQDKLRPTSTQFTVLPRFRSGLSSHACQHYAANLLKRCQAGRRRMSMPVRA